LVFAVANPAVWSEHWLIVLIYQGNETLQCRSIGFRFPAHVYRGVTAE